MLIITGFSNSEKFFFTTSIFKTILLRKIPYNFISSLMQLYDLKKLKNLNYNKNEKNKHFQNL